jgi:hypothetical protein
VGVWWAPEADFATRSNVCIFLSSFLPFFVFFHFLVLNNISLTVGIECYALCVCHSKEVVQQKLSNWFNGIRVIEFEGGFGRQ